MKSIIVSVFLTLQLLALPAGADPYINALAGNNKNSLAYVYDVTEDCPVSARETNKIIVSEIKKRSMLPIHDKYERDDEFGLVVTLDCYDPEKNGKLFYSLSASYVYKHNDVYVTILNREKSYGVAKREKLVALLQEFVSTTVNDYAVANRKPSTATPAVAAAKAQSLSFDEIKDQVYFEKQAAEFKAYDAYDDGPGYRVQFSTGVMRVTTTNGGTKMMEAKARLVDTFDMRCLGNSRKMVGGTSINLYICEAANDLSVPARSWSGDKYQFEAKKGSMFFLSGDPGNRYHPPSYFQIR